MLWSHNSLSGYQTRGIKVWISLLPFWLFPLYEAIKNSIFAPFAKCQSLDIKEQYDAGVRGFDIRVKYDKIPFSKDRYYACAGHGLVTYNLDVRDEIDRIVRLGNVKIRILLENRNTNPIIENMFRDLCADIEYLYKDVEFYGGHKSHGSINEWRRTIYNFRCGRGCMIDEYHASVARKGIEKLFRKYYSRKLNKIYKNSVDTLDIMLDYVEY